jgi:hypothetical protein
VDIIGFSFGGLVAGEGCFCATTRGGRFAGTDIEGVRFRFEFKMAREKLCGGGVL